MTTTAPRWAAVVVNYEAGEHLVACVESLLAGVVDGEPPEVVVVDNGSVDGSTGAVTAAHPDIPVLRPGANLGYARSANLGIAATRAPVVAVLNPDTRVEPGTGTVLTNRLVADPTLGAVGPRVRNPDGSTYPSARSDPPVWVAVGHGVLGLVWATNPFTRRYRQLDADSRVGREVDWVSGAAIWLRRAALDEVGGWDERYFMYVEDVDLCWRLRRRGWRVAYEPAGEVVHTQGVSTDRRPYRMIVEHHRSLARFASARFTGPRRVLLVPTVAYLSVRAVLGIVARALGPRYGRPRTIG